MKLVHGRVSTYKYHGCRCDLCSDAGSKWMREYYRKTEGLTKMLRTGKPIEYGSQGGVRYVLDGSGPRGHHKNATRRAGQVQGRKQKPMVVDFESDDND